MSTSGSINKNIHQVSDLDLKDQRKKSTLPNIDFKDFAETKVQSKLELY